MPLTEQERRCINLACRYFAERHGGVWSVRENLDDRRFSEPTPEVIVGNGTKRAAVEVKRIVEFAYRDLVSYLRSNERRLAPSCGGSYYLCPALGVSLPMSSRLQVLVKREIERVAPFLSPGQKGAVRISRLGRVFAISSCGPPFISCLHGGPYSNLMSRIRERISGKFMLSDEGPEHSFVTQECEDAFVAAVVLACNRSLAGDTTTFKWDEEWELIRTTKAEDTSADGVWVVAGTDAHSMQESVQQCVHAALDNALRKFKKTPPWAEVQAIVLDCSSMTPARLAAKAVDSYESPDKQLVDHFLVVDGDNVEDVEILIASLEREAEAKHERQQAHIAESAVSETRVQRFRDDYLKGRREVAATEKVFSYHHVFDHKTTSNYSARFGFDRLVKKGPFVDGSNWLDLRGWEFAVAQERYLLGKLRDSLAVAVKDTGQVLPDTVSSQPEPILDAAKRMAALLGGCGTGLVVVAAHLDIETRVSLEKLLGTPAWCLPDELRTSWILGENEGCIFLHLSEQDSPRVYVVDVPRYASLIQYEPLVDLQVSEIDEATAARMLEKNPSLRLEVDTLVSMVRLTLYQSYEIQVYKRSAVWSANLSVGRQ